MRINSEESKKLRHAFAADAEKVLPGRECPDPEHIYAAVLGESPLAETRKIVAHTATCAACAEAWRLALAMGTPPGESRTTPVVPMARWRRAVVPVALAASLVLLSLLGYRLMFGDTTTQPPVLRNGGTSAIRSLVPEDQPLVRNHCLLRWELEKPRDGARFEIQITSEDLFHVVAIGHALEAPEFLVGEDRLAGLPSGSSLLWWVKVTFPDGSQKRSKTFTNHLR